MRGVREWRAAWRGWRVFAAAGLVGAVWLWAGATPAVAQDRGAEGEQGRLATVSGVAIASSPAAGGSYKTGENIDVEVTFGFAVAVTGAPQLAIAIGTTTRQAAFQSVSDETVSFRYRVVAADFDGDGIAIGAGALTLNGGSIRTTGLNPVDAGLDLGSHAIAAAGGHAVNDARPSFGTATVLNQHWIASTSVSAQLPAASGGDGTLSYALSGPGAATTLSLPQGLSWDAATRTISGQPRGMAATNSYTLTARDGDGDQAQLSFGITVADANAPKPRGLSLPSWRLRGGLEPLVGFDGNYETGDMIFARVTFDKRVTVNGAPRLALNIGGSVRQADYLLTMGDQVVFAYTVTAEDFDGDGLEIAADALTLNGGSIVSGGLAASLGLGGLAISGNAGRVNDTQPSFEARVLDQHWIAGMTVSAQLPAARGDGTVSYALSGPGAATTLSLPQGLSWDAATRTISGKPAAMTATASYALTARDGDGDETETSFDITVAAEDALRPMRLTLTAMRDGGFNDGNYREGETIWAMVSFAGSVTVTGTPQLALDIGGTVRQADYSRTRSLPNSISFMYRVTSEDFDRDGLEIAADALTLNGGSIVSGGLAVSLGLGDAQIQSVGDTPLPTVRDKKPAFSQTASAANLSLVKDVAASATLPAATGGDGQLSYSIAPALPAGLVASGLTVTGTPTEAGTTTHTLTATDGDGDTATLGPFSVTVATNPVVTGVAIASSPAAGDSYKTGETITVDVTFNQPVSVTGAPQLAIAIGATTRQATGSHSAGESKIAFSYTVATDDRDSDGISIAANALTLNGGTIGNSKSEDARLGSPALAAQTGHKVSSPPKITAVRLIASDLVKSGGAWSQRPPGWEDPRQTTRNWFAPSVVMVMIGFDQDVTVIGTPQVALRIGSATRQADYDAHGFEVLAGLSNPRQMRFYYELQPGDHDGDGLEIAANALTLNGGTIRDGDGEDAALGLGSHAISSQAGYRVADLAPAFETLPARRYLLNMRVSDRLPAASGGDGTLSYTLTGPGGATTLSLPQGLSWDAASRTLSGTPTGAAAAASYRLTATDRDGDEAVVSFDLAVVTDPVVADVAVTSSPAASTGYEAGETITVDVTFDQAVAVTGTPQLALTIGSKRRLAVGSHSAGESTIAFSYTVATGDRDSDGISIAANALTLNGGTIGNAKGEDARLSLGAHAVVGASGHKVSTPPKITEVRLDWTSWQCCWRRRGAGDDWKDPRQTDGTNNLNLYAPSTVLVTITFNQDVTVTGTPQVALGIGSATRQASYDTILMAGSTTSATFYYELRDDDHDGDGVSVAANALTLNGGTIRDGEGENAVLGLGSHAITNKADFRVADTSPSFGAATIQPQHWVAGSASSLTMPEASGDGTVSYALTPAQRPSWMAFDAARRVLSGTPPAAAARASYRWTATDGDGDATALGFTLTVAAANAPKISEVKFLSSPAAHRMYGPGSTVTVGVKFDKAVAVTGTPTLALAIGTTTRQASYSRTRNGYLEFAYTVAQADYDPDGVSIGGGALALPTGGSGSIVDAAVTTVRAALGLGSHAIANDSGHMVGSPPRVTGVSFHSTPPQAGTYTTGATVVVQVDFDQTVTVTGTPQLALNIGGQTRQASASPGTGNAYIRFSYPVVAADMDSDGLGIATGALTLNGGAIRDSDGQDAALALGSHARAAFASAKVDGSRTGRWPVFAQAAGPDLTLAVGTAVSQALPTASGGDGRRTYAVSPALPAGLVMSNTGLLSGTPGMESPKTAYTLTATDSNGDTATLAFTLKVTGNRPVVSGVTVASTPLAGDSYGASEEIRVDVTFQRVGTGAMMVQKRPQLAIAIGATTRTAEFLSVSGATLRFRYTVQAADRDTDGLSIAANALKLNGGLIRDAAGNNAILALGSHALGAQASHKVNGATQSAPTVSGVRVISTPGSGQTYTRGEAIEVELRFDQAVGVSSTPKPQLALTIGSHTRQAAWNRAGASPTTHIFRYTVQAADSDSDGLSIAAGALTLNGGTIQNTRGTNAVLALGSHALGNQMAHKVDGTQNPIPVVTGISIRSSQADRVYDAGETIEVRVTFNKDVMVQPETILGSSRLDTRPRLAIAIGATTRQAIYHASPSDNSLDFRYTVQDPDHDSDGISIAADALDSHGGISYAGHGRITQPVNNPSLGSHALGNQAAHKVDGRTASVTGVAINSTPARSAGYGAGETIRVKVTFSNLVNNLSDGSSRLALAIGSATRHATLSTLLGPQHSHDLYYEYTVQRTDRDADGISIVEGALTGSSLRRREGNPVNLALGSHALGAQAAHKVTGAIVHPRVSSVSVIGRPQSNRTYALGEEIEVRVTFDIPIFLGSLDGYSIRPPQLALAIGTTTHRLDSKLPASSHALQFKHTVGPSDLDADGISIAADALTLPTGVTLTSQLGAGAALDLGSHALTNVAYLKVNGSSNPAAVGEVGLSGQARHDTFLTGERFKIAVEYSKTVTVTGTPTIALQVGSMTRRLQMADSLGRPLKSYRGRHLNFYYTVQHGDRDPDGISIAADALSLEGATITGPGGVAAQLRLTNSIVNDRMFRVGGPAQPTPTFGAAVVPARVWTVGMPVDFTLPPATDGDGTLSYALTGPGTSVATLRLPGGLGYSYSASTASVPSGGRIHGTPTAPAAQASYRLTATDSDDDKATLDFTIEVKPDLMPSFGDATIADKDWIEDDAIVAFDLPAATGGNGALTYALSPALPGGLARAERRVSGTPDAAAARTQYTWTVTDADGDEAELTFHATVAADTEPSFGDATIADKDWIENGEIVAFDLPAATGGNGTLTYALSPALPGGLARAERRVSGTPNAAAARTQYTWTVTDADGDEAELTFHATVAADTAPSFGDSTIADRTWTQHQAITAFALPAASGGDGDLTYALAPDLPAGLTRDATTRGVSGTPSAALAATTYTWTATDADGDRAQLTFTAAVNAIPSFGEETIADAVWLKGKQIDPFTLPEATGGDGRVTYALSAAAPHTGLPDGVVRDTTTREVSGTPTVARAAATYTWTATDTDGDQAELTFTATVAEPPAVTLILSSATIDEHDGTNPGVATVTAVLDKASGAGTTVTVEATAGTNATDGDFTLSAAATLTIAAGATASTGTVTIAAVDNAKDEDDKTVTVTGSAANDILVTGPADLTLTIADDDAEPALSISAPVVAEGAAGTSAALDWAVTLSAESGRQVTVAYAEGADGTATAGADYTALADGTLTFAAGETGKTISVTVTGDAMDEPNETVVVTLSAPSNATIPDGAASGTGTITDDDAAPDVTLAVADSTIAEDSGTTTVSATLSHPSSAATTVTVTELTGAYTMDSTDATIVIAAGDTASASDTATIDAVNDAIDNVSDRTVTVTATASNDQGTGSVTGASLTLTDDEGTPTVTLALSEPDTSKPDTIAESGDGNASTVTASLSHASSEAVTLTVSTAAGTGAVATDFAQTGTTLTIAAGATASTGVVTVTANDDATDAPDKQVTVTAVVSGASGVAAPTDVTLTIADDDDAPDVTLSLSAASIDENGGETTVSAALSHPSSAATTVTVTAVAGAYTVGSDAVIVIAAGATVNAADTATVEAVDDSVHQSNVGRSTTVTATASNDQATANSETMAVTGATLTLTDDETLPTVTLALSSASISENGGVTSVTATLSGASSEAVVVTVMAAPDFTLSAGTTLTIAASATTSSGDVTLTANDNATDAPDKQVTVAATAAGGNGVANPAGVMLTLTDDDDAPGVTLTLSAASIAENGGETTVSAALSHPSSAATTVTVTAVTGAYTVGSDALIVIAAGDTVNAADTATVEAVDDSVHQGSVGRSTTVTATASNDQAAANSETMAVTGATLTLTDDETLPTVTLALSPTSISETGGVASVTATLSGASSAEVVVTVGAAAGAGADAGDFDLSTAKTLTIAAGDTASSGDVTVTANDNDVHAPNKSVTVSGTVAGGNNVAAPSDVTLTLTDDETLPTVTLALSDSSISETGGETTVTARLSGKSSEAVVVTVAAVPGTGAVAADFALSTAKTLTIAAGTTTGAGTVTVTANGNDLHSGNKSVTVSGAVVGGNNVAAPSNVTLTLTDDETLPTLTLALSSSSISETGGVATVTATLSGASSEAVTVTVAASPGTGAVAADFDLSAARTLTIAAGATASAGTVTVTANGNDVDSPDKRVTISAMVAGGNGVAVPSDVTLTLTDDETLPTVALALSPSSISETGGVATVTARLSGTSSQAVTVTVAAAAGTGAVAADFDLSAARTLTIAAGATTSAGTVTVTANGNDVDSPDKRVTISAMVAGGNGVAVPSDVTLTLTDDEATPTATLKLSSSSISETGGVSSVTATLSGASSAAVTLTVSAAGGGFTLSGTKTLTVAAGDTTSTGVVTVTAVADTTDSPDKSATVSATASGGGVADPSAVTLTITDDDAAPLVTLALSSSTINENGTTTQATVTARLSHPSSEATTVRVSASPVSSTGAVAADYMLSNGKTLTIAAGNTASVGAVTVTAADNDVDAPNKQMTVSGRASNSQGVAGHPSDVMLTIADDEALPTVALALSAASISESGEVTTVTARLSGASSEAVTVTVGAAGAAVGDFTLSNPATLTIAAGDTTSAGAVTVMANGNDVDSPDKQVTVSATASGGNGVANPASKTLTISDDDAAPGVTLVLASSSIAENGGATTVSATLSHPSSAATTVTVVGVSGFYTAGLDATIVIAVGETANASDTATITAVDDAIDNVDNRTVTVTATASNDQGAGSVTGAMLTLTDDEGAPTATLKLSPSSISESGGVSSVTARLSGKSSDAVTVTVEAAAGTGAIGADFALSAAKTLTIAAGSTASSGAVTVTANGNDVDAPNKQVTVSGTASGGGVADPSAVPLTIADDDAAPSVTLALSSSSISENGGVATVTARLSGKSSQPTTVTVSASAGLHTSATDFTQTGTTLTVSAGATASTGVVTVSAVNDEADATHDKKVTVSATAANGHGIAGNPSPVTLTIEDDDVDLKPTFGDAEVADQSWPISTEIARLTLPAATGGDGALTYALSPSLPSWLRRSGFAVTGTTPSESLASADYEWMVRDEDGDKASLTFAIEVVESGILNPGAALSLSLSSPRVSEGASGSTATLSYEVTLSAASTEEVTVRYADAGRGQRRRGRTIRRCCPGR